MALLWIVSALLLLLIHHLLLDKLGMATVRPHPSWLWLWHLLLVILLMAHILLILALLLHVSASLARPASPSGLAPPIIHPDIVRQCRPWRLHMHSLI